MKVAVVTQYFPTSYQPWAGHSAYQTLRLLASLCDLQVFYPEAAYPRLLTPAAARRPPIDRSWNPSGVAVTYIPYPALPVISRPLNGFAMAHALLPHVREFRPDLILNYVIYPDGYAAVRIARTIAVPAVLIAIGSDLNRIPDPLCGILTRSALRHADFVATVSGDLGNTARALGAPSGRTQTLLNGCDTAIFHPHLQPQTESGARQEARQTLGLEAEAEIVLYVGRLDLRKGLIELIEAVSRLHSRRPKLHCYLVGDGPDRAAVLQAIETWNAATWVTLVPSCPTRQVALWMAASYLVTLPSYREGCPNVVLEALAAGRPVVATRVGGIPELMDDSTGRLIPPGDPSALEEALHYVLSRHWDAAAISSRHSRSWSDVAADLYAILQRTTQNSSSR